MFTHACRCSLMVLALACAPAGESPVWPGTGSANEISAAMVLMIGELDQSAAALDADPDQLKTIRSNATGLALLAQELLEQNVDTGFGKASPTIRQAALELSRSRSADAARRDLKALHDATEVNSEPVPKPDSWESLSSMRQSMALLEARRTKLRQALRKPNSLAADSRQAMIMSLLGRTFHEPPARVKDAAERQQWRDEARKMAAFFAETAAAMRGGDVDLARDKFAAAAEVCANCHAAFRP